MVYRDRFYICEEDYAKRQTRGVARCGDILFTTEAPRGYVALADQKRFSTGQRIITFQWPNATEHNNRYFLYYFMSDVFQDQVRENASGATAQGIKSSRLVNLSVLIPECQKQSQVVARLSTAKARAEKLEAKAREGVAVCETMRKAILKEAFAPCCAGEVA
ncbi:MAG: restriction endonuclease subunit S [Kiritimatiellae bacterium]|nr:restriction endonuclease subunit S [Kiritimatiellia bacterium]